ncbi:acyl-CoA thioesterase [Rhodococcus sp. NPDC003318]|uniref:acyl-CoA thioesterase n=1 Tax=Rhodococcus sp. NPDC003318 TaxID=3364503 RepID=UPI0036997B98
MAHLDEILDLEEQEPDTFRSRPIPSDEGFSPDRPLQGASLDHTLWFFRDFRADDWLVYDQASPSSESGRALVSGRLFDSAGRLVAAAAREGLVRFARTGVEQ